MSRKRSFTGVILSLIFFCLSVAYFAGLIHFFPSILTDSITMGRGDPREILVEPGLGARKIAEAFSASGLTDRPHELSRWFARLGIDRSLRPGLYRIRPGSPWEIAKQMEVSEPEVSGMTILPGETYHELTARLGSSFEEALGDDSLFPQQMRLILPEDTKSRLAFLLPETYSVTPSPGAVREVVKSASELWLRRVGGRLDQEFFQKMNLFERAIIASLVEKEARKDSEREVVAGVIENRSNVGMKLQIDATVVYAWALQGVTLNRVLYRHLEIDSPYNTYLYQGLPPAPICIPSESSWKASLEPQKVPFLYYVAMPDGSHIFSKSYSEHLEAVRRSRKAFGSDR